jgi:hypothetical protein
VYTTCAVCATGRSVCGRNDPAGLACAVSRGSGRARASKRLGRAAARSTGGTGHELGRDNSAGGGGDAAERDTHGAVATVRLFGVILASSQTGQPAPLRPRQGERGQSRATGQGLRWSLPPPPAPGTPFMALPRGAWPASSGTLYRRVSDADAAPQGRQRKPIMIGANSPAAALQGRAATQAKKLLRRAWWRISSRLGAGTHVWEFPHARPPHIMGAS